MGDEMKHGRRGFLRCMAWAGTGLVWTMRGGVLTSRALAEEPAPADAGAMQFVQISDSHVGYKGAANPDALVTLNETVERIRALAPRPRLLLHTGDLTHAQKAGAFDLVAEALKGTGVDQAFFVPGEHDVFVDGGKEFLARFGKGTTGNGWRSFDDRGVHFVGLVNVLAYKGEGVGMLGDDQLAWLAKDLERLSASTPVVVYAHVPLWAVYPAWGWTTGDGERALALLRRFGSVTVLNGHIHQVLQKTEGTIAFYTAASTAFPQPAPGQAKAPGPMAVPAEKLRSLLGLREVRYVAREGRLAVVDESLSHA
jgi:3',5'-cyclic-AMP phosphodiesterase